MIATCIDARRSARLSSVIGRDAGDPRPRLEVSWHQVGTIALAFLARRHHMRRNRMRLDQLEKRLFTEAEIIEKEIERGGPAAVVVGHQLRPFFPGLAAVA